MPPLGLPYAEPSGRPPSPQYPVAPPEQWPTTPAWLAAPQPVAPAPARPRWIDDRKNQTVVWGAIAIVIAVIVGVLVGRSSGDNPLSTAAVVTSSDSSTDSSTDSSSDSATDSSTDSSSDTTTTTQPPSLDSVVLDIEKFVEQQRGLKYKDKVDVSLVGEGEFQQLLLADFDKQRASLLEEQQVLDALGLVPAGFDVVKEEKSLLSIAVLGFYDPATKRLVVRATSITPFSREVLAHELTHALDDQWFDLNRPKLDNADDESGYGFSALAEGNARRVEDAYVASMSPSDQAQATFEQADLLAQHPEVLDLPSIVLTFAQSPYDDGSAFVQTLLTSGGQARLDAAFRIPPVTSEQILQPDRYIAGEGPVAVPAPKADAAPDNVGVLGALLLREMLFDQLPSAAEVQRAITGWGGDSYVTWTDAGGDACLRDSFVGDTNTDTQELAQAIEKWGQAHNAVIVAPATGPATFTVCGHGS